MQGLGAVGPGAVGLDVTKNTACAFMVKAAWTHVCLVCRAVWEDPERKGTPRKGVGR